MRRIQLVILLVLLLCFPFFIVGGVLSRGNLMMMGGGGYSCSGTFKNGDMESFESGDDTACTDDSLYSGAASENPGEELLTDSSAPGYAIDELIGNMMLMTSGAAIGNKYGIDDNTTTTITCTGDTLATDGILQNDTYQIKGWNIENIGANIDMKDATAQFCQSNAARVSGQAGTNCTSWVLAKAFADGEEGYVSFVLSELTDVANDDTDYIQLVQMQDGTACGTNANLGLRYFGNNRLFLRRAGDTSTRYFTLSPGTTYFFSAYYDCDTAAPGGTHELRVWSWNGSTWTPVANDLGGANYTITVSNSVTYNGRYVVLNDRSSGVDSPAPYSIDALRIKPTGTGHFDPSAMNICGN